jgi:membrane associated rhomboid family serine protease
MKRLSPSPLAFPDFRGVTRILILANLATYFALLLSRFFYGTAAWDFTLKLSLQPYLVAHGSLWQPFTYSLVHFNVGTTLFELLSMWFLLGFLENLHPSGWVFGVYASSVLGAAASAVAIFGLGHMGTTGIALPPPLYGCFGGLFGLLAIIGTLHGETEFLFFFTINLKAKYMAAIYGLVTLALLFGQQQVYAFSMLGGAFTAMLYVWMAPQRGFAYWMSEGWYGLANGYYRWKRRRAGRKFEVYMRSQGKTIHLDGNGKRIDDERNPKHWN